MRVFRVGVHLHFLTALVAILMALPSFATANDLCPYDASGDYTYDASRNPTYEFFGDGQITYSGAHPWYLDDTLACYNVYKTPGYLPYFPKCDLDRDGLVDIAEVYEIYYRVHPVGQPDLTAGQICIEAFRGGPFFFCPPSRYNRTVADLEAIPAHFPAAEAIFDPAADSLGQGPIDWRNDVIHCTTPGVFPEDPFAATDACYLGDSHCAGGSCLVFLVPHAPSWNALEEYNDIAQNFGGICEYNSSDYESHNAPGFHFVPHNSSPKWWHWDVRATAECDGDNCKCRMSYKLWTHADYPGQIWLSGAADAEENLSRVDCTDPRFPEGTLCIDSDWDTVCDADDQCHWGDDTIDTDGDGTPDCLDLCPSDPNKTEHGLCGCGRSDDDLDGDGLPDLCPACPAGDIDGDGVCNDDDLCIHDPNKSDPGCAGCGVPDIDADGNGIPDACEDICMYGDDDNDGVCNDIDECPLDPSKSIHGVCGCGHPDIDNDGDGVYTCQGDLCDDDPNKTDPGVCGCGVEDIDPNGDGCYTCEPCSGCEDDPSKPGPGVCGCGIPDIDNDGDGVYTCQGDACDDDPNKTEPGVCGCGVSDLDRDQDGAPDCVDGCPLDPYSTDPAVLPCEAPCLPCYSDDLADVDWGSCPPRPLGAGIVNGACSTIFGCEIPAGITLYANVVECITACNGCLSNSDCAVGDYCKWPALSECGTQCSGMCEPRPDMFDESENLVCGCDVQTYTNEHFAAQNGVSVNYYGPCD